MTEEKHFLEELYHELIGIPFQRIFQFAPNDVLEDITEALPRYIAMREQAESDGIDDIAYRFEGIIDVMLLADKELKLRAVKQ